MSDVSKKIFSIDPTPDEHPIAIVPDLEEAQAEAPVDFRPTKIKDTVDETEPDIPLRRIDDIPDPVFRPIMHLVKPIDESDNGSLSDHLTIKPEPIAETVSFITDETQADEETPQQAEEGEERFRFGETKASTDEPPIRLELPSRDTITSPVTPPIRKPIHVTETRQGIGWIGPVLTLLTGMSVASLIVAFVGTDTAFTLINLSIILCAALIPMISVITLWIGLRAFSKAHHEAQRLAAISETLIKADETVASDVSRLSTAIRLELSKVDEKLAQTRNELDALSAVFSKQVADTDTHIRGLGKRSQTITKEVRSQSQTLSDMSKRLDAQLASITQTLSANQTALSQTAEDATTTVEASATRLAQATQSAAQQTDAINRLTESFSGVFENTDDKLGILLDRMETQIAALREANTLQSESSQDLDERLSTLIHQAKDVHDHLSARLSDIDTTLSETDQRARAFTSDMADRVGDSLAQTRRELSIMEGEIRTLQTRLDQAKSSAEQDVVVRQTNRIEPIVPQLELTAMDDEFSDDLSIPIIDPEEDDQALNLLNPIEQGSDPLILSEDIPARDDLVRRPGDIEAKVKRSATPKPDKNWRWRDMLGGLNETASSSETQSPKRTVQRPGPGIPLSPPPAKLELADAPDILSRLAEVELPPQRIVEDVMVQKALSARQSGGEDAQSSAMFAHLNAPIIHLRGVLSADPVFRTRVENFRRDCDATLSQMTEISQVQSGLFSETGRAYLLCAAALFSR